MDQFVITCQKCGGKAFVDVAYSLGAPRVTILCTGCDNAQLVVGGEEEALGAQSENGG